MLPRPQMQGYPSFVRPLFSPRVSQGLAPRRGCSLVPSRVSASQRHAFAAARTLRLGSAGPGPLSSHTAEAQEKLESEACSPHPGAGHSKFLERQWVLTSQARWQAGGRRQWACVSPQYLPAAALSRGPVREAKPSKAQRVTQQIPTASAQGPG